MDISETVYNYVCSTIKRLLNEGRQVLGIPEWNPFFDARRIALSIQVISQFHLHKGTVVEVGSPEYLASKVIWSYFSEANPIFTNHDLRFERFPQDDESVDALIALEVIEHLSDWPYRQATTLSGLFYFLEECFRILRPGGKGFFTTPNAASLWVIQRALLGQPPMFYEWHFREYTPSEIRQIMEYIGFRIVHLSAEYVWHMWDFSPIIEFMVANGYDTEMRGDDLFIVVEKPIGERVRKEHGLLLPVKSSEQKP